MINFSNQKTFYFSSYIGIILLYVKLFFVEAFFTFQGVEVTLSLLLLLVILVRVVFKLTILHIPIFRNNKYARLFWILILVSTISAFILSPEIATGVVTVNFQLFLIYLIFVDFKTVNISYSGLKKVINTLVYFGILNAILVVYTFFFGKIGLLGEISAGEITRAFGLMGDQVAWFLSFFGVYSLYSGKKYLYLLFFISVIMGASLGASIILLVATIYYFIKEKAMMSSFYFKVALSIVFLSIAMLSFPSIFDQIGIIQRITKGDFANTDSQTTGHRYNAITHAIDKILEKPFWGYQNYSLTMFNEYNLQLSDSEKGNLTYLTTPNNQILAIICDYGLIGLGFFITFIYSIVKIIKGTRNKFKIPQELYAFQQSVYVWFLVFLVFNQSATWFLPGSFLWILICILLAICYKINKIYSVK